MRFFSSTMSVTSVQFVHFFLCVFLWHVDQPFIHFHRYFVVSTQLDSSSFFANVKSLVAWSQFPWHFVFRIITIFPLRSCSVYRRMIHTLQRERDESLLVFVGFVILIFYQSISSSPLHSVATLSQTHPRLCHPLVLLSSNLILTQIFLAIGGVLVQKSAHVSPFSFLMRKRRLIALVSHPLILSRVLCLHDQFCTPNGKHCRRVPPSFYTTLATARLYFC